MQDAQKSPPHIHVQGNNSWSGGAWKEEEKNAMWLQFFFLFCSPCARARLESRSLSPNGSDASELCGKVWKLKSNRDTEEGKRGWEGAKVLQPKKKNKTIGGGGIQLDAVAPSLHIAAGECALKTSCLFKWKGEREKERGKKRSLFGGEEFSAENRHSIQQRGDQRVCKPPT